MNTRVNTKESVKTATVFYTGQTVRSFKRSTQEQKPNFTKHLINYSIFFFMEMFKENLSSIYKCKKGLPPTPWRNMFES